MEDQVLERFGIDCIIAIRICCRKYGYYRKQAFVGNCIRYHFHEKQSLKQMDLHIILIITSDNKKWSLKLASTNKYIIVNTKVQYQEQSSIIRLKIIV